MLQMIQIDYYLKVAQAASAEQVNLVALIPPKQSYCTGTVTQHRRFHPSQ
jgi:hypothetical protein